MDYNNKIDSREITFLGKKVQLSYNAPCFWDLCLLLWLIERKVASYFLLLAFEFLLVEPRPGPSRAAHCPCRLTSPRCWCASLSLPAGSQVLEAGFCVCVCVSESYCNTQGPPKCPCPQKSLVLQRFTREGPVSEPLECSVLRSNCPAQGAWFVAAEAVCAVQAALGRGVSICSHCLKKQTASVEAVFSVPFWLENRPAHSILLSQ